MKDYFSKMDSRTKKQFITIAAIALVILLFIIFANIFKKDTPVIDVDVPIGVVDETKNPGNILKTDYQIDEKERNIKASSSELAHIIKKNNASLDDFGSSYIFDGQYIFPSRNIQIKKSFNQIISITFNSSYKQKLVNDVTLNMSEGQIIQALGLPNHNEAGIITYKAKDFYIIFNTKGKEATAYFRTKVDMAPFWLMYDRYNSENDLKNYISDLTTLYPAYTRYEYDSNGLELIYTNLGVRIYIKQYERNSGIYLYSDYESTHLTKEDIAEIKNKKNVNIVGYNLSLREEILRIENSNKKKKYSLPEKLYEDNKLYRNINVLNSALSEKTEKDEKNNKERKYKELKALTKYSIYIEQNNPRYNFSNVSIMSKNNNNHYNINTAKVADNLLLIENFVFYSIKNEGIYRVNVDNGQSIELYSGEGSFELKYVKDNYIYFDDLKTKAL